MVDNLPQTVAQDHGLDDGIDLLVLFDQLWLEKWKIIGFTLLACVLTAAGLLAYKMPFVATTVIRPISTIAADVYTESNAHEFFTVTREELELLVVDSLRDGLVVKKAAEQVELFEREGFDSDADYQEAIHGFSESITLIPPINEDGLQRGPSRPNWLLVVRYNDAVRWLEALEFIEKRVNKDIRDVLRERFMTSMSVAQQQREFKLQDIDKQVENVQADYDLTMAEFETRLAFDLEDTTTKIDNALADYDRATSDRLAYLIEQAAIARKLGVAKSTIEAQMFSAQGGVLANVETDTPFYLRGFEAIEKEVELIESRVDKRAFVSELVELEKIKREIEQDPTLARKEQEKQFLEEKVKLKRQSRAIQQDATLDRAQTLFEATPIWSGEGFEAARFVVEGTEFNAKYSKVIILGLTGIFSGMLSCGYVLLSSVLRNRSTTKSQIDA